MIPEIAGYKGRAIYLGSDQIVFKDISQVYNRHMGDVTLLCCNTRKRNQPRPMLRSSFMLLDCARLRWNMSDIVADLDASRYSYQSLFSLEGYGAVLPAAWNSLDQYRWPLTALLHYTGKENQPWIYHRLRLAKLWFKNLFAAVDAGYIDEREAVAAADNRLVRPSIKYQLEQRLVDPRRLPDRIKQGDVAFFAACARQGFNNVPGEYRASPTVAEAPMARRC